jgi:hypothetical protein
VRVCPKGCPKARPPRKTNPEGRQVASHELVLPGSGAVMRESQEVEGLRASLPSGGSLVGGVPPELDQPGLALMERQAELQ